MIVVTAPMAEQTQGSIPTTLAESRESMNSICERNTLQNLTKLAPARITIQTDQIHVLSVRVNCPLNKRNKILEELCLIDDHNCVRRDVHIVEILRMNTGGIAPIVGCNKTLSISHIRLVSNHQNGNSEGTVARNDR